MPPPTVVAAAIQPPGSDGLLASAKEESLSKYQLTEQLRCELAKKVVTVRLDHCFLLWMLKPTMKKNNDLENQ